MNGLRHDAWAVFQEQREKAPNWKWSFNLAVALHAAVFAGAVFLPDAVETPRYDDVIIVDLLSLPASAPPPASASVAKRVTEVRRSEPEPVQREQPVEEVVEIESTAPDVIPEHEPEVEALAVSPPEPEISPEPIAQVNPVSLRPLKRKKKLVEDTRLAEVKEREEQANAAAQKKKRLAEKKLAEQKKRKKTADAEKRLAKQKKQQEEAADKKKLAADARRGKAVAKANRQVKQAERAAVQAERVAARARQEYASVSQVASDINTPLMSGGAGFRAGSGFESESWGASGSGTGRLGGSGAGRANADVIERQYGATLNDRIRSQWQLPEIITTKSHLKAMVALTVRRDGSIEDMRLEQRSGDAVFDQSVLKALRNAEPMPSFPALIHKSTLEFALNFTPQGLTL
jgi:TolA protein